jgi:hypothetical protein
LRLGQLSVFFFALVRRRRLLNAAVGAGLVVACVCCSRRLGMTVVVRGFSVLKHADDVSSWGRREGKVVFSPIFTLICTFCPFCSGVGW